jgi:hypothetical protein
MTQNLSSYHSGNPLLCHDQTEALQVHTKSKWCCFIFTTNVLSIISIFYKVGTWTNISIYKCWDDVVHWKQPQKWESSESQIHHNNAPAHSVVCETIFGQHSIPQGRQPPNSTDMAPCDFILFPELKRTLNGQRINLETIKHNAAEQLLAIPKLEYQSCFDL